MASKNGQRVTDVVARFVGTATVLPIALSAVVNSEVDVSVVAGGLIATGTGLEIQGKALSQRWFVLADDISQHVVDVLLCVDPGADREIHFPQLERVASGYFDICAAAIETTGLEVHPVIHTVVPVARVVATVADQLPTAKQTPFGRALVVGLILRAPHALGKTTAKAQQQSNGDDCLQSHR